MTMKVLMFGWEFPPHITGGLGTACYGLTKSLASLNDIDLTFVVPKAYGDELKHNMKLVGASDVPISKKIMEKQLKLERQKFYQFNQAVTSYTTPEQYEKILAEQKAFSEDCLCKELPGKFQFCGQYGTTLFQEISRYGVVASEISGNETYDIIHAHDWLTFPAGIQAKKASGKPLIVHVHATEFDRCGEKYNEKVFEIERMGMESADKVITVSDFTRNIVINKYKIDPSKVVTIHNGVEPVGKEFLNCSPDIPMNDHVVTFLGRITKQKGPEYFVQAAFKVLQKMDNVRFVMAGSGDLQDSMVKFVARLKIADKFHFTGFLKGEDVFRMYAKSDLYVMPSVSEPFGISPLEAMQCNVPVIISKQSGVSEVLKNVIKVDYWDIDSMADAIYGVLNYKSLGKMMKKGGMKEIGNLNWDKAASKIKNIYDGVA
jgi:glycosyltransferase involved in cell wall biosynthesis